MKTHRPRFILPLLAAAWLLVPTHRLVADAGTVYISAEATVRSGTSFYLDIDESTAGYVLAKYSSPIGGTGTGAAKGYYLFDLTGQLVDTNSSATFTIVRTTNSGRQLVQLWGLNQTYPAFDSHILWATAQANDTNSNAMLTNGALTASLLGEFDVPGSTSGSAYSFTIPAPWGQVLVGNKVVFVLTGVNSANNSASGMRSQLGQASLTFNTLTGNLAPTISPLTNLTLYSGQSATNFFTVNDDRTPAANIYVYGSSSDNRLVPLDFVVFTGETVSSNRSVVLRAGTSVAGTATITVNALDGDLALNQATFTVTVLPAPFLTPPPHTNTLLDVPLANLPFTVGDVDTPATNLLVSGSSVNDTLVPAGNIALSGSGSNRTVSVTPAEGVSGVAPITLTVDDGAGSSNSAIFAVMVRPAANVVFCEFFDYPDGNLGAMSGNFWSVRAGATPRIAVAGRQAVVRTTGESLIAPLAMGPYASGQGTLFYTRCRVMWTSLPRNSTGGFVHLYDSAANLLAKVNMTTNNSAEGFFRVGLGSGPGNTYVEFPRDLTTNVSYNLVTRYDLDTGTSMLWIDAGSESETNVVATDVPGPATVTSVGLRQNTGMGEIRVDQLLVTISTRPVAGGIQLAGENVEVAFKAGVNDSTADFLLLRADNPAGPFNEVAATMAAVGAGNFQATALRSGSQGFYLIKRKPQSF